MGPYSSADYRNGSDIESDNAYYDRITQQALQNGGPGLSDSANEAEVMAYRMREAGFDGEMTRTGGRLQLDPGSTDDPRLELQSRIAGLSAIRDELRAMGANSDSAITDRLNRESTIRETVSPRSIARLPGQVCASAGAQARAWLNALPMGFGERPKARRWSRCSNCTTLVLPALP